MLIRRDLDEIGTRLAARQDGGWRGAGQRRGRDGGIAGAAQVQRRRDDGATAADDGRGRGLAAQTARQTVAGPGRRHHATRRRRRRVRDLDRLGPLVAIIVAVDELPLRILTPVLVSKRRRRLTVIVVAARLLLLLVLGLQTTNRQAN